MEYIDCSGLPCPQPVIKVKKALDQGITELRVTVDNDIARQNVLKLLAGYNYQTSYSGQVGKFTIVAATGEQPAGASAGSSDSDAAQQRTDVVYFITSEMLGDGDAELGKILMRSLLYTISERPAVKAVVFMNRGVFLACAGSAHIEVLQKIAANGVEIVSCGTCLDYYNIKDKLLVGSPGNMYSALDLLENSRVVRI